jgi:Domain of unknown function (DUF4177)
MQQWEYRVVFLRDDDFEIQDDLNEAGAEGWELVSVTPQNWGALALSTVEKPEFNVDRLRAILKRPKQ